MRPLHRPKAPTIDYRDKPKANMRLLGGTLLLGISIGAAGVLLVSMTRPQPKEAPGAPVALAALAMATPAMPERAAAPAAAPAPDAIANYKAHELKNALMRQASALRACYEAFLQDEPDVPEGKVTIDFQIDPDGKVLSPGIVESELEGAALADCLVARVASFAFPPPPDRRKTYAAHTFFFKKDAGL